MMFNGCFHQSHEEGMGTVGAALKFRMGLGGFEVGVIFQFDGFYQTSIRLVPQMERPAFSSSGRRALDTSYL